MMDKFFDQNDSDGSDFGHDLAVDVVRRYLAGEERLKLMKEIETIVDPWFFQRAYQIGRDSGSVENIGEFFGVLSSVGCGLFVKDVNHLILCRDFDIVNRALSSMEPSRLNEMDDFGFTLLNTCVGSPFMGMRLLPIILELGVDPFQLDSDLAGALHAASNAINIDVLKPLIDLGLDVNLPDGRGRTPLVALLASYREGVGKRREFMQCASILLMNGADPDMDTPYGRAFDLARRFNCYDDLCAARALGETREISSVVCADSAERPRHRI